MKVKTCIKKNRPKSSVIQRVVAFRSLKAEKAHFEKIEVKVFGAIFEKKIYTCIYAHWRINDGFKLVFDVDQHPEVHQGGNDYSFALICKESTTFPGYL